MRIQPFLTTKLKEVFPIIHPIVRVENSVLRFLEYRWKACFSRPFLMKNTQIPIEFPNINLEFACVVLWETLVEMHARARSKRIHKETF
jgi:hypothetical protein